MLGKFTHTITLSLFICVGAVLIAQPALSQNTIKGKVTDSVESAVPYAALGLMNSKDTSLVKSVLTDDSGRYTFTNVKSGSFIIKVVATGYAVQYSLSIKTDNGNTIQTQNIALKSSGTNLKAVQIKADKPFVERKEDRTIYNMENSILASGKNALEVLNDLPGITADDNGNISVLAKGGALVLVDDRPLRMDLATFLKGIDGNQIERIEVITNPSAKYEAQGKAVINIILKKDKNMGLNGMITALYKQGFYAGGFSNLNLDYREKKWNFFCDANGNAFHNRDEHTIVQKFISNNSVQDIFNESASTVYQGTVSWVNAGVDFSIDNKQSISFSARGDLQSETMYTTDNTIMHTPATTIDSSLATINNHQYHVWNINYDLNYKYKIDTSGRELSVDLNYTTHQTTDNQVNPVYYYNAEGEYLHPSTLTNSTQQNAMQLWSAQADYTQPLNKKSKLDIGVLSTYFKTSNNVAFYNDVNNVSIPDSTKSNQFDFSENIFAGYLNYSQKINEKINFQAGVRAEETQDNGLQHIHDTSFTRNYLNLFPSAGLNWNAAKDHAFSVSYTRRIDRPDYSSLNPFVSVIDPYTYYVGNIALIPVYSNNYEFDYTFKQFLTTTLWYINMANVASLTYHQNDSTHITYSTMANNGSYYSFGIMISASLPVTSWLNTSTAFIAYHDNYNIPYNGTNYVRTNNSIMINTNNTINLKKHWKAEINFRYNSSNLNVFNLTFPVNELQAGLGKSFYDDKLAFKINFSDILKGQVTTNLQSNINTYILDTYYGDMRKFRFSISWKFGRSEYQREQAQKQNLLLKGTPK